MLHSKVRAAALAGCAVGVLLITGCGAREPVETPPAGAEPGYGETRTPDLMGAPPSAQAAPDDGLLGGPPGAAEPPIPVATTESSLKTWRRPDGTLVTAMAPIANPDLEPRPEIEPRPVRHPSARVAPARRVHVAAAPVAAPIIHSAARPAVQPAAKPTLVAKPPSRPATVTPAPAPLKPITAAAPAVAPTRAPVVAPIAPATAPTTSSAAPAKPRTKLQALQAAVAPEATRGATLATAPSLAQGQAGQVTLSLPATLGEAIKTQAAKLGLAKAASKTSAYADLRGQGYEITPSGRQTAVVKAGQPATFAWQVKPTDAAKGPLKTEFGVALNGTHPAQAFTLGSIARQAAPLQDAVTEKARGLKAALPDLGRYETIDVPGVGRMPTKSLLGAALVLLALLILVAISRNASVAKARAERRRKVRTQADYGRNALLYDTPETTDATPAAAATGGATAIHGRPEHNPFETPTHEGAAQAPRKELDRVD
ncbi:hypothetical protein [Caulobacter sp. LjRoot300]|uniref:hypothetical protein n=1 Tax=Caulobacter sp. LjRoot300 TaxID=3342321 RepID=UPI003ED010F1